MASDPRGPGEPEDQEPEAADAAGLLPDMARRALALGLSSLFTTEETIRRALGDTVPQEWVDFASSQSERTQREFSEALAREVAQVIERMDLAEVLSQVLTGRELEVHATIRLQPAAEEGRASADASERPAANPAGFTVSIGSRKSS